MTLRSLGLACLAFLLAGCASPLQTGESIVDPAAPAPSDSGAIVTAPASVADTRLGSVAGTVRGASGAAVAGVRVGLVSVAQQGITDNLGQFLLADLEPGPFVLRAQKPGFQPAATPLDVVAGGQTRVDIVLVADDAAPAVVDFWQGRERVQVMDGAFAGRDNPLADQCLAGSPSNGAARWDGPPVLRFDDPHQLVWPGTAGIEVTLDWSDDTYSGGEMLAIWKHHPDGDWGMSALTPKGSVITIDVAPEQADSPHRRFTAWQFAVCTKDQSGGPQQSAKALDGLVHATMTLVRGHPLPLAEPEADLWGDQARLLLVDETKRFTATDPATDLYWALGPCNGLSTRSASAPTVHEAADVHALMAYNWEFALFEGLLVPNGTARIEARLDWTYGALATPVPLHLSYRGADVAPWVPADPSREHVPDAATDSSGSRAYSFAVPPALTDGADDVRTAWRFYWNIDATTLCDSLDVHLVVEAVRAA